MKKMKRKIIILYVTQEYIHGKYQHELFCIFFLNKASS